MTSYDVSWTIFGLIFGFGTLLIVSSLNYRDSFGITLLLSQGAFTTDIITSSSIGYIPVE